ncbi:hypothetical protein A0H81_00541 [Grifola frondosa]|uniref:Protein transport protein BET1 n=1 Tax=Grifola frondosa TaxID=5627 RepID=A0A1C7MRV9_GRIFR|nr:hypothetical protein A0H81_00541 [Grifola frondosa]
MRRRRPDRRDSHAHSRSARSECLNVQHAAVVGRSSPYGFQPSGQRFADDLEGQNDEHLEGLAAKVKILKEVNHRWYRARGTGLDRAAHADGSRALSSLVQRECSSSVCTERCVSETSGILAGTFRRMNNMATRQGCRWLWYIVFLIIVFWFFIIVWWFRR